MCNVKIRFSGLDNKSSISVYMKMVCKTWKVAKTDDPIAQGTVIWDTSRWSLLIFLIEWCQLWLLWATDNEIQIHEKSRIIWFSTVLDSVLDIQIRKTFYQRKIFGEVKVEKSFVVDVTKKKDGKIYETL